MEIEGKRFLVIGGAGFIGSHVVDQLLAGNAAYVRIYDNFSRGTKENLHEALKDPRTEIFPDGGDILHRDILSSAMQGIDGVFHLAAMWLLQCQEYPRSAFEVNVTGTMNVIEAAIANKVKRLVFSSSASVYGDAVTEPIEESHPLNCQEFYGASKVSGEMLIRALSNQAQQKGQNIEYVGLRYMNVYGPRQYDDGPYVGVIARMLNALNAGIPPVIHGDGTQAYDFIHVRDCARANILAMLSNVINGFYNVGTGTKTSINDLVECLSMLYQNKLNPSYEVSNRPFVRNRIGSTELAEREIGFKAATSLSEGLKEAVGIQQ